MIQVREDPHPDPRLDDYLDGRLSGADLAEFERRLTEEPALRRVVAAQHAIDASIIRTLTPDGAATMRAIADTAVASGPSTPIPAHGRRARPLALAAALLLLVSGAWLLWSSLGAPRGGRGYEPGPWRSVERVRADALAAGFAPEVVCRDDDEFERWFRDQLGRGLRLAPLPAGVETLGLGYSHTITPATIHLLARAGDEPIVVFVDRGNRGRTPEVSPGGGLHLHRRHVGDLVLYELSSLDTPRLLPHFRDPDAGARDTTEGGDTGR